MVKLSDKGGKKEPSDNADSPVEQTTKSSKASTNGRRKFNGGKAVDTAANEADQPTPSAPARTGRRFQGRS